MQVIRLEAAGDEFKEWLASPRAALPLALVDAAAAQKLPSDALTGPEPEREAHCQQLLTMFQVRCRRGSGQGLGFRTAARLVLEHMDTLGRRVQCSSVGDTILVKRSFSAASRGVAGGSLGLRLGPSKDAGPSSPGPPTSALNPLDCLQDMERSSCITSEPFSEPGAAARRARQLQTLLGAGNTLGLEAEVLHDAVQLLDRAACLGLLPATQGRSPGSGTGFEGAAEGADTADEALMVAAAILISCKSRARPSPRLPPFSHAVRGITG